MRYSSTLSALAFALVLAGCGKTSLIGRGYSSFKEPYKSEAGLKAAPIGYRYSAAYNEQVVNDMRFAAKDLVSQMETGHAVDVERIYLTPGGPSAFYTAFDHVLRDELTYRGYELVTVPESGALPVTVAASETNGENEKGAKASAYRELDVALVNAEKTLARGTYILPAYGFTRSTASLPETVRDESEDASAPVPIAEVSAEPLAELPEAAVYSGAKK
ncbi:MAG: hypothetical protein IPH06_07845 [Alphaproteobacteria bacterium]|jgi:hypothetical protein|nr:hypothetical protein [Alphaproteobacteria bacterium]QQS57916.1 MAG: hypothetical protein IPN28_03605 [Alphaproteobacteria bacterium]